MKKIELLSLIKQRRFLPIFLAQLFGALNDNFYKTALSIFIVWNIGSNATKMSDIHTGILVNLVSAIFIFPFFIFSGTGGQLADKYDKAKLMQVLKFFEIPIAILALIGFIEHSVIILFIALFLLATQFSFFGPVKFSILPDHLKRNELIAGNGLIEGTTFIAILIGTIIGTLLISIEKNGPVIVGIITLILAIIGWISSFYIMKTKKADPNLKINWNFFSETKNILKYVYKREAIFSTILGISWFWLVGICYLTLLMPFTKQVLNAHPDVYILFLTTFTVGIAIGSLITNNLLNSEVDVKFVPLGIMGMSVFMLLFVWATRNVPTYPTMIGALAFLSHISSWYVILSFFGMAFFAGFFVVPLNTTLQTLPAESHVSRVIAANNIMNSLFMVVGSLVCALLIKFHQLIPSIFFIIALANIYVGWKIICVVPDAAIKSFVKWIFKFLYRVEIKGMENYEKAGKRVLIVPNHVSFIDPCFIIPFFPDKFTFAINTHQAKRWWIKPLLNLVDYFPIDPANPMSLKSLVVTLRKNKKVVIFPEGRITVTGRLMKIYEGPGLIADKAKATVLPVRLDGPQYTPTSRIRDKVRTRLFPKVTVTILPPQKLEVPKEIKGHERRNLISERLHQIMINMMYETEKYERNIFEALIDAKEIHGAKHPIVVDINGVPLNYRQFITKSFALGRYFSKRTIEGENLGIMLPNAVASAVSLFACYAWCRVPTMINFTGGLSSIKSAIKTAKVQTVITSKKFVEQAGLGNIAEALKAEVNIVYLENVKSKISPIDKVVGLFGGYFPATVYKIIKTNSQPDDPAVILFTSGTENLPKGVVLTHKNILGNCAQVSARVDFSSKDIVFNALPLFHSFGFTGGTIMPIIAGIKTFFYPSPLHYRIVPEQIYDTSATIMFGTDTFLSGYAKYAHPYDFYSVRYVFAGAEKLKEETRKIWMEKFGVRVFEGYGVTEASPIVSVNTPMHYKSGTVGRFLSGIEHKLEKVPGIEKGGKLWIKGVNIMKGYLRAENPGVIEPPAEGWYDTGDIVSFDEDNYMRIEGRAKRFAKIGGEMVSLGAVENFANEIWPEESHAVVNLPDPKKGEMLVLVTTVKENVRETIIVQAKEKGLSEIMLPKKVISVAEIPLLGSGKVDYRAVTKIAEDAT